LHNNVLLATRLRKSQRLTDALANVLRDWFQAVIGEHPADMQTMVNVFERNAGDTAAPQN
jgi:hypothetical protein